MTERDANRRRGRRKLLPKLSKKLFALVGKQKRRKKFYTQSTRSPENAVGDVTVGRKMLDFSSGESQHHHSPGYVTRPVRSRRW